MLLKSNSKMKQIKLLLIFLLSTFFADAQKAKIAADFVKPITGTRTIVTTMLPVFQMKVIQVAAMAEIGTDTTFTLAYYLSIPEIKSDRQLDTSNRSTIIVLRGGTKVIGKYLSTTDGMGLKIVSYKFSGDSFKSLAEQSAIAYSINFNEGIGEYTLDPKYQDNIKLVCQTIIDKLKKDTKSH